MVVATVDLTLSDTDATAAMAIVARFFSMDLWPDLVRVQAVGKICIPVSTSVQDGRNFEFSGFDFAANAIHTEGRHFW